MRIKMKLLVLSLSAILVASGVQDDNNTTELEEQDLYSNSRGPCDRQIEKYFPRTTQKLNDIARAESKKIANGDGSCKEGYLYQGKDDTTIKVVCKKMTNARGVGAVQIGLCYRFLTNNRQVVEKTNFNVHRKINTNDFQNHGCDSFFHDYNSAAVVACAFENP